MKHFSFQMLSLVLICIGLNARAQETFKISGIVVDQKNEPIPNATIFISGSKKITATNIDGRFVFAELAAGNYIISTKLLGYSAPSQTVIITDKSVAISIGVEAKSIALKEVSIGIDKNRERYLNIFKDQFLGTSRSAANCVILNPELINFTGKNLPYDNVFLKADADDLLTIENKQLGYRVKYLLKAFEYNSKTTVTYYEGDSNFEDLDGTDEQKQIWAKNRLAAYSGSLMHFLRSVYSNTVLSEGFITNQMVKSSNSFDIKLYMNPTPVSFDSLVTIVDSSFVSFKFTALNVLYNPKKASKVREKNERKPEEKSNQKGEKPDRKEDLLIVNSAGESSQLLLYLPEAVIDARGSVSTGHKTFLIRGNWAGKRIGAQLPFEYLPPKQQ